jgi:hypothetical protein
MTKWKFHNDDDEDTHGRVYEVDSEGVEHFRGFYEMNPYNHNEAWVKIEGQQPKLVRFS